MLAVWGYSYWLSSAFFCLAVSSGSLAKTGEKPTLPPDTTSMVTSYPDCSTDVDFIRILALAKGLDDGHLEVATAEMKGLLQPLPWVWKPYLAFILCATASCALVEVANFYRDLSWHISFLAVSLISAMAGQFAFGLIFQKGVDARDARQEGALLLEEMYKGIGMACLRVLTDSLILAIAKEHCYPDFTQRDIEVGLPDEDVWLDLKRGKDLVTYPPVRTVLQVLDNIAAVQDKLVAMGLSQNRATKICIPLTYVHNNFVPGLSLWRDFAAAIATGEQEKIVSTFVGAQKLIGESMIVALRSALAGAVLTRPVHQN